MSRWRKVDVRIWGDERVRKLSRPHPSGLGCWLYLLTARESTALPGAIPAGPATLAESLGWSRQAFLRCFSEIENQGMARADWEAGLVWLPKALRYNPPQSPNAAKAWAKAWEELPDCELKSTIRQQTEAFLKAFGKASGKTYLQVFLQALLHTEAEAEEEAEEGADPGAGPEAEDPLLASTEQPASSQPVRNGASREQSDQEVFVSWFEENRKEILGGEWREDTHLPAARLNKELMWIKGYDVQLVSDAAQIYLEDPRRQKQNPPCSIVWFAKDCAEYLSRASRGTA